MKARLFWWALGTLCLWAVCTLWLLVFAWLIWPGLGRWAVVVVVALTCAGLMAFVVHDLPRQRPPRR